MSLHVLKDRLAQLWLARIPAFSRALTDTGKKYDGHPVFLLRYSDYSQGTDVLVYRYCPLNSEMSALYFVPDGAVLNR